MCRNKQEKVVNPLKILCFAPEESSISNNTVICRYFDGVKCKKLLDDQAIWFSNISEFPDQNERTIPESYFYKWKYGEEAYKKIYETKTKYISSYVSCWSIGPSENYALWKLYDPMSDGCMIQTTIGKLRKQLEKECPESIIFDKVKYIDPEKDKKTSCPTVFFNPQNIPDNILCTEIYKIFPYKYEEEIRAVFYSRQKEFGFNVSVDLSELIDCVYLSPFSKKKVKNDIKKIFSKIIPYEKMKESIIREKESDHAKTNS